MTTLSFRSGAHKVRFRVEKGYGGKSSAANTALSERESRRLCAPRDRGAEGVLEALIENLRRELPVLPFLIVSATTLALLPNFQNSGPAPVSPETTELIGLRIMFKDVLSGRLINLLKTS